MNFDTVRKEYVTQGLTESDLDPNPLTQFQRWYEEAVAANVIEPNAMTLATATRDGIPSARTILLKGFDERGFTFYTNYESQKAKNLPRTLTPRWCFIGQRLNGRSGDHGCDQQNLS